MASILGAELNGLIALEAVGRLGSVMAAAEEMGVSPGAVSQQIKKAEAQIGRTIFDRTAKGLIPTSAGLKLLPVLTSARRQIADGIKTTRSDDEFIINITVGSVFASNWLVPRLNRFSQCHPDFQLRLVASSRIMDLTRGDIDFAIRLGTGGWRDLSCEKLFHETFFPVCAPSVAALLSRPEDLANVPILFDEETVFPWPNWQSIAGAAEIKLGGPTFTDPMLAFAAAVSGQGVLLGWNVLTRQALEDGRLVKPFAVEAPSEYAYWLAIPPHLRKSNRARVFRNWLLEEIEKQGWLRQGKC